MESISFADFRHRAELARAIRNRKWEATGDGRIYTPAAGGFFVGGVFEATVNGSPLEIARNTIPTQGMNHILDVVLGATAKVTTWYVAPFSNNVTPAASWTAANFNINAAEITTAYDEPARVELVVEPAAGGVISNTASKAEFTFNTAGTCRGFGIFSAQDKGATTGILLAAAKLGAELAFADDFTISAGYTLTLTNAS